MAEQFVQAHLRNLPLFAQLTPPQIGVVAGITQVFRLEPGQLAFQEGQPTRGLLMFVSGRAVLTRRAPDGSDERLATVESGQYIDEAALYNAGIETASLHVVETAIVLLIPRDPFVRLVTQYPEIRANVRIELAQDAPRTTAVKLFKGQREDEAVLQVWRRHWWATGKRSWIALVVCVVLFALALLLASNAPALALGAAGLAVIVPGIILFYLYWDWQDDSIVLTDQRIVRIWNQILAFETTLTEIPLDRVLEVNVTIPPGDPFARLFHYGTVFVKTAGEGANMSLEKMPDPLHVQSMIFLQRDRFRERVEQRQREMVRTDIAQALGITQTVERPAAPSAVKSNREHSMGPPFARTKMVGANGDLIYRKHLSVWIGHITLPSLLLCASLLLMAISLIAPTFPLYGGIGIAAGAFTFILGAVWFYFTDWDWRNDLFIIGNEALTLIRKRPLWLQNEVDRIRIAQIDNVQSVVGGLFDNLLNRGDVRIFLVGASRSEAKIFDNVFDPQDIQAEISRRQSAIKAERQQGDIEQQREVVKEYLQTYHELQQAQPAPPPPPPAYTQPTLPNPAPTEQLPPPSHDGIRPPRVPRARSD